MTIQQQGSRDVIAYIVRHLVCDACGEPYAEDNVSVAVQDGMHLILEARCDVCHAKQAVTAYDRPPYEQLRHVEPVEPALITQADVDEWAAFLDCFTGDLYDLLAQA